MRVVVTPGRRSQNQKMFFKIRTQMENAIKSKDHSFNLEIDEMQFLDMARSEVKLDFEANEAVVRVNEQIDKAIKNFESKYGKPELVAK